MDSDDDYMETLTQKMHELFKDDGLDLDQIRHLVDQALLSKENREMEFNISKEQGDMGGVHEDVASAAIEFSLYMAKKHGKPISEFPKMKKEEPHRSRPKP